MIEETTSSTRCTTRERDVMIKELCAFLAHDEVYLSSKRLDSDSLGNEYLFFRAEEKWRDDNRTLIVPYREVRQNLNLLSIIRSCFCNLIEKSDVPKMVKALYDQNCADVSSRPKLEVSNDAALPKRPDKYCFCSKNFNEVYFRWTEVYIADCNRTAMFTLRSHQRIHWIDMLSALDMAYPKESYESFKDRYTQFISMADSASVRGLRPFYSRSIEDIALLCCVRYHRTSVDYLWLRDTLNKVHADAKAKLVDAADTTDIGVSKSTNQIEKELIDKIFSTAEEDDRSFEWVVRFLIRSIQEHPSDFATARYYTSISKALNCLKNFAPIISDKALLELYTTVFDDHNATVIMDELEQKRTALYQSIRALFIHNNYRSVAGYDTGRIIGVMKAHFHVHSAMKKEDRMKTVILMLRTLLIMQHMHSWESKTELEEICRAINADLRECGLSEFYYPNGECEKPSRPHVAQSKIDRALVFMLHNRHGADVEAPYYYPLLPV